MCRANSFVKAPVKQDLLVHSFTQPMRLSTLLRVNTSQRYTPVTTDSSGLYRLTQVGVIGKLQIRSQMRVGTHPPRRSSSQQTQLRRPRRWWRQSFEPGRSCESADIPDSGLGAYELGTVAATLERAGWSIWWRLSIRWTRTRGFTWCSSAKSSPPTASTTNFGRAWFIYGRERTGRRFQVRFASGREPITDLPTRRSIDFAGCTTSGFVR